MLNYTESSICIGACKQLISVYRNSKSRIYHVYQESLIYKTYADVTTTMKTAFRYSILYRITEQKEREYVIIDILETSRAATWVIKKIIFIKEWFKRCSRESGVVHVFEAITDIFYQSPLKIVGAIAFPFISLDLALLFLSGQEARWYGIVFRVLLLFISCVSVFSACSMEDLRESSFVIRRLEKQ